MIIAVDFDKTLHTGEWPLIGAPVPYAVDVMNRLKSDGHYLIIWTCREAELLTKAVNWMKEKGIPFDRVNDNVPGCVGQYGYNARKVFADVYIDDQQLGGLPTWNEIYDIISKKVKPVWHYELTQL
jgi:hypothetical protein